MTKVKSFSPDHKALIRRYLLWAYKSTKESFERIERKTTQLIVDEYVLADLLKNNKSMPEGYEDLLGEFKTCIANKRAAKHPQAQYMYLKNRLAAIEKAIKFYLGAKELKVIEGLYEEEFTRRILEARDH